MLPLFVKNSVRRLIPALLPMFVLYFCISDGTAAECDRAQSRVIAASGTTRKFDDSLNVAREGRQDLPLGNTLKSGGAPQSQLVLLNGREVMNSRTNVDVVE